MQSIATHNISAFLAPAPSPIVREIPADLETPVSAYLKLAGLGPSFLLESVTGGEQVARYSFIGTNPSRAYIVRGQTLEVRNLSGNSPQDQVQTIHAANPLEVLKTELATLQHAPVPGLPRFTGGLVGYLGYEMMRFFEPSISLPPHHDLPDAIFLLADTLVAFDHAFDRMLLIANLHNDGNQARSEAEARLRSIEHRLNRPMPAIPVQEHPKPPVELHSDLSQEEYVRAVEKAKWHITAGDIFQVVLSQRMNYETTAHPFSIYRALRRLNPSPYMYYFDFGDLIGDPPLQLIGASPEMLVRLDGRRASIRPIAGTRPRGQTPVEDLAMEQELLADPKERAEHIMLVDLARNDLGRVCDYGSVCVPELMGVERYSHVMHIVSHVEGQLRPELDAFDLLRASFPAGTVTGAPKIRAMQIINELENNPRGPYAGSVGYFSYDGSMDTCITIRTLVMRGQTVSVQAGAGIVADSEPHREYQETLNKARALAMAVEKAEEANSK